MGELHYDGAVEDLLGQYMFRSTQLSAPYKENSVALAVDELHTGGGMKLSP